VLTEGDPSLIGTLVDIEILSVGPNSLRGRIVAAEGLRNEVRMETPH
jgi:hypothetical protein